MRSLVLVLAAGCSFNQPGDGPASCSDNIQNGDETGVDCGGSCGACGLPAQCKELHAAHPELGDGAYAIGSPAVMTYCDMTVGGGGWTLVGKVDGKHDMTSTWLVSSVDPGGLLTPTIEPGHISCLDAVDLAVKHSTEIRLSNSARTRWVSWPLPEGRMVSQWWHHEAGHVAVVTTEPTATIVTAQDGTTTQCFQNIYGINPIAMNGGGYPDTAYTPPGSTRAGDSCLSVGTMTGTTSVDGFTQNGNGFDAPPDENTWPNQSLMVSPHVAVWLR